MLLSFDNTMDATHIETIGTYSKEIGKAYGVCEGDIELSTPDQAGFTECMKGELDPTTITKNYTVNFGNPIPFPDGKHFLIGYNWGM